MTGGFKHNPCVLPWKTAEKNIKGGNILEAYIVPTYGLINAEIAIPRRASVSLSFFFPSTAVLSSHSTGISRK